MKRTIFTDIGGVLLTNGWDRHARQKAADTFQIDLKEMDDRHQLSFELYEVGKISLDQYLDFTIFYTPRNFTQESFKRFMFAQSEPFSDMLEMIKSIKFQYNLNIVAISNEGRELSEYRIKNFLGDIVDYYVISSFVHLRKPDQGIFQMALDLSDTKADEAIYLEDRPLFVEVANRFGMQAIHHQSVEATYALLKSKLEMR